jgi:DNA-binding NarL/FixJ family response regulator
VIVSEHLPPNFSNPCRLSPHPNVALKRSVESEWGSVFPTAPKSVLIVDDNASIRQALCGLFEDEADFEVCGEAENGKVAVEKAQELRPDLIVLDLSMPVMNGLEAARVLKRLMPTVPLIMFSAFSDGSAQYQARLVGISEVVSKSEHPSVLILKARSLLKAAAA